MGRGGGLKAHLEIYRVRDGAVFSYGVGGGS